jgi:hypothetical protein
MTQDLEFLVGTNDVPFQSLKHSPFVCIGRRSWPGISQGTRLLH